MTKITDYLWLGNSSDAAADVRSAGIDAAVNVAVDLPCRRDWGDGFHYAHCGLIDGPGNSLAAYYSAVLQLASLVQAKKNVLLFCHDGFSRSAAVAICWLNVGCRRGWGYCRDVVAAARPLPAGRPHGAHRAAFEQMDWYWLATAVTF